MNSNSDGIIVHSSLFTSRRVQIISNKFLKKSSTLTAIYIGSNFIDANFKLFKKRFDWENLYDIYLAYMTIFVN